VTDVADVADVTDVADVADVAFDFMPAKKEWLLETSCFLKGG
jgi:hypothetical protein